MKKGVLILVILLLLVGCSNVETEINEKVLNNSYQEVYDDIDYIINGSMSIKLFPTEENEEKLYYYTKAIINNLDKYSDEEKLNLYNLMNIDYSFSLTDLGYDNTSYHNDLDKLK